MRYYVLLTIATLLMASAFVAGKVLILQGADALVLVALRFCVAGGFALSWLRLAGQLQVPANWASASWVALIGLLHTALLFGLGFSAMQELSAATVSLLTMTMPLWVALYEAALDRRLPTQLQATGLACGIFGVALVLNVTEASDATEAGALTVLSVVVAAAIWGVATVISKRLNIGVSGWSLNAWQMVIGGMVVLLWALVGGLPLYLPTSWAALLTFVWLSIPASILSFGLWFRALGMGGATTTSGYLFLVPLFTALLSMVLLNASFGALQIAGGILIALAIWLISRGTLSTVNA